MTTDDQYPRPDPDQAYEDWAGVNLIEEHERHPERFKTVTAPLRTELQAWSADGMRVIGSMDEKREGEHVVKTDIMAHTINLPQTSPVAWDRQPDHPESHHEFPCTDCGGDAYVGMSGWRGPQGVMIDASERLCMPCAKKRGVANPLS